METFTLGGDPSSIRASARLWGNFSTTASGASSDIKSVNTTEWVGDESEVYRGRIHKDLVPHLDVTAEAWGIVKTALNVYAGHLESLQSRMSTLRIQHAHQQIVVRNAQTGYVTAKAADKSHHDGRQRAIDNRTEGQTLPADTYIAQSGGAFSRLQTAQQTLQGLETKAGVIRIEHAKYVRACCDEIGRAKKLRPVHPPGWRDALKKWVGDRWNDVKSGVAWAAEHLGPILKVISAVAGMLALIPCLAPIMGPIALVAGGAALALDIMNKLMNGKGSWLQIGLDTLALVPGIKPLTTAGKLGKMASATRGVEQTSSMVSRANRALTAAKASGHGIKDAKSALSAARALNMSKYSQLAALTSKYKKIDNIWKGVDAATTVTTTGLTTYKTYRDTGSWKQALLVGAVSSLGTKIPGVGRRFTAVQNVVNTAGSTLYTATGMLLDPKKFNDPMQWVKLTTGVGKFGIHGYNGSTYQTAGTHPNGSARAAYELPSYWG
jgi:hypothetical protein